jgi:GH24 family phage-related lysozyme (muramidase)
LGGKSSQSTQQVTIPPEVLARYNAVNAQAQSVAQTPFQAYSSDTNAFVAPLTAEQQAGMGNVNAYANSAQPGIQTAEQMTQGASGAANPAALDSAAINKYMNPYTQDVTNQMSQLMGQQFQQAQSGQMGNAIKSGAFGGDRAGVAAAALQGQQALAYGNAMAPVLQQGYNTALATGQQQQGVQLSADQANLQRQMAGAAQYGQLATQGQSAGLAGAQSQMAAGQTQQQTQQAGLTALYNQFLQQQSYPFQTAQFLANIAEGTGALSGQTTTSTQPSSFFSDRRLKENIKKIGTAKNGLPIYSFNYKGDPEKLSRLGFMADEVEKKHPEAVGLAGGFKTVDYEKAARPKRYAGGLVHEDDYGQHFMRGGFDQGGSPDWSQLLAQHGSMYGQDPSALGGGDPTAPSMPGRGRKAIPLTPPAQHHMLQPAPMPKEPQGGAGQIMNEAKGLIGLGKDAKGLYQGASKALSGGDTPQAPSAPSAAAPPPADAPAAPADSAPAPAPEPAKAADAGDLGLAGGDATQVAGILDDLPSFGNRGGLMLAAGGLAEGVSGPADLLAPTADYTQGLHEAQDALKRGAEVQQAQSQRLAGLGISTSPDITPLGQAMDNQGVFHSMQTYGGPGAYIAALQNLPSGWGGPYARGGLAGDRNHFSAGGAGSTDTTGKDSGDPEGIYDAPGGVDIPNENPNAKLPDPPKQQSSGSGGSGIGSALGLVTSLIGLFAAGGAVGDRRGLAGGGESDLGLPGVGDQDPTGGAVLDLPPDYGVVHVPKEQAAIPGDQAAKLATYADAREAGLAPAAAGAIAKEQPTALAAAPTDRFEAPADTQTAQGAFEKPSSFGDLHYNMQDGAYPGSDFSLALARHAGVAPAATDVPLPPERPTDLGGVAPVELPTLAQQPEPNPVVRAGNAVSGALTQGVEGAGSAVKNAGTAVSGAITGGIHAILGHEEGFRAAPYQDGKNGPLAIGYGSHTIMDANGNMRPVQPGDRISQPAAQALMDQRLKSEFIPQAQRQIGAAWSSLSQRARDGIASVTYNYGHVPGNVVAAARTGDDGQIANAIASLLSNPKRRAREAAYVSGQPVSAYQANAGGDAVDSSDASSAARVARQVNGVSARDFKNDASDNSNSNGPGPLDQIGGAIGGAGKKGGDWFGENQNWLIPLLTGVGTMASSNSRYLGSAILQGLGGGAQAYAQQQQNQADLAQKQANTGATNVGTAQGAQQIAQHALFSQGGHNYVQLADGSFQLAETWLADGANAKPLMGGAAAATAVRSLLKPSAPLGVPAGAPAPSAQAAPQAPVPPDPHRDPITGGSPAFAAPGGSGVAMPGAAPAHSAPAPGGAAPQAAQTPTGVGHFGAQQADTDYRNGLLNPSMTHSHNPLSQQVEGNVMGRYSAAVANGNQLNQLAAQINAMPGDGPLAGGPLNAFRAHWLGLVNDTLHSMKLPEVVSQADIDTGVASNKISRLLTLARTQGADQHSLGALQDLSQAVPSTQMTKAAANKVLAGEYVNKQMDIDRANYLNQYKQRVAAKSNGALSDNYLAQNAMNQFDKDHPNDMQYLKEKAAMEKLLNAKKGSESLFPRIVGGDYNQHLGEFEKRLEAPGISRYLHNN